MQRSEVLSGLKSLELWETGGEWPGKMLGDDLAPRAPLSTGSH